MALLPRFLLLILLSQIQAEIQGLGCFGNQSFVAKEFESENLRIQFCVEVCLAAGVKKAGLRFNACFCFNDSEFESLKSVKDSECDPGGGCVGNTTEICGDETSRSISVYDIQDIDSVSAQSCVELATEHGILPDAGQTLDFPNGLSCNRQDLSLGNSHDCDEGWIEYQKECYQFLNQDPMDFDDANRYCRGISGDLASIHSTDEHDFLAKILSNLPTLRATSQWYLGLYRQHGGFSWTDGQLVQFTQWGNPSVHYESEQCVVMNGKEWKSADCNQNHGFVCKMSQSLIGYADMSQIDAPRLLEDTKMTVTTCIQHCKTVKYAVQAFVAGTKCHCGLNANPDFMSLDALDLPTLVDALKPCLGHPKQWCGTTIPKQEVAVYKIEAENKGKAESCYDLALQSVLAPADYQLRNDIGTATCNSHLEASKKFGPVAKPTTCDDGWFGYQGSCYRIGQEKVNWFTARDQCWSWGGFLAHIWDKAESDFILYRKEQSPQPRSH